MKYTNLKNPSISPRMCEVSSVVYTALHRLAAKWDLPIWPPRNSAGFILRSIEARSSLFLRSVPRWKIATTCCRKIIIIITAMLQFDWLRA